MPGPKENENKNEGPFGVRPKAILPATSAMSRKEVVYSSRVEDWERSLTYNHWVPISCGALELLLPYKKIFGKNTGQSENTNMHFWGNHPIYNVYMVGIAMVYTTFKRRTAWAFDEESTKPVCVMFEIDDGTGPLVLATWFDLPTVPDIDMKFVEVYGRMNVFRGVSQIVVQNVVVPEPNLRREIELQHEAVRIQTELLSKPIDWGSLKGAVVPRDDENIRILSFSRRGSALENHSKFKLLESL